MRVNFAISATPVETDDSGKVAWKTEISKRAPAEVATAAAVKAGDVRRDREKWVVVRGYRSSTRPSLVVTKENGPIRRRAYSGCRFDRK